jgi:hypothetical protein
MKPEIRLTCFVCINVVTRFRTDMRIFWMRSYEGNVRESEWILFIWTSKFLTVTFLETPKEQTGPKAALSVMWLGYTLNRKELSAQARGFIFSKTSGTPLRIKVWLRDTDQPTLSSANIKNEWMYISTPPHAFMLCIRTSYISLPRNKI